MSGQWLLAQVPHTVVSRAIGLLGTSAFPAGVDAVLLYPCRSVHTFGMRYPIDLAWLSSDGCVLKIDEGVRSGRVRAGPTDSVAVLEFPGGHIRELKHGMGVKGYCTKTGCGDEVSPCTVCQLERGEERESLSGVRLWSARGRGNVLRVPIQLCFDVGGEH